MSQDSILILMGRMFGYKLNYFSKHCIQKMHTLLNVIFPRNIIISCRVECETLCINYMYFSNKCTLKNLNISMLKDPYKNFLVDKSCMYVLKIGLGHRNCKSVLICLQTSIRCSIRLSNMHDSFT